MKTKDRKTDKNCSGVKFSKTLKYYFIPHDDNDHKPFIIRHPALIFYALAIILTKLIVTGFLFISYPSFGQFATVTTSSIVNLTNQTRRENKLPELKTSVSLNRAAFQKAQDMINNNYFSHTSPSGIKFWKWISGAGYKYSTAGENLAMDFSSANSVHQALLKSVSHRNNILNSNFTNIGVSIVSGRINNKDTIILVEMFGASKITTTAKESSSPTTKPQNNVTSSQGNSSSNPTIPSPFYKAEVQSLMANSLNIKPLEEIPFWVEIKNIGNTTWYNSGDNFIALNVTDPAGRISPFKHSSWLTDYRPTKLSKDKVLPLESIRFEFALKAPNKIGNYNESFQLVAENLTWIEGSRFTIPIIVSKPPLINTNTAPVIKVNQDVNNNLNTNNNLGLIITNNNTNEEINGEITEEPTTPIVAGIQETKKVNGLTKFILVYAQIVFWFFFIFISLALLINIFVKIRVQHFSIIIPTLLVILLAVAMLFTRLHFMEDIISQPITIL